MKRLTPRNAIHRMVEAGWTVRVMLVRGDVSAKAERFLSWHAAVNPDYDTAIVALAETVLAGREVQR